MIRGAVAGLTLLGLAGCSGAVGASLPATHDVQVSDPQYSMTAFTVPVPSGWKSAAQIVRGSGCHATSATLLNTVASPDGSITVEHLPGVRWAWSSSPLQRQQMLNAKCPAVDISAAASVLLNIAVPNLAPGAAITAILPLEDKAQASLRTQLQQMQQSAEQIYARYHVPPPKHTLDGARVRIRFKDHGKLVEEQIQTIVDCSETESPAMYSFPATTYRNCNARNFYVVRAPLGHLQEALDTPGLEQLSQGIQINQQWFQQLNQDLAKETQAKLDASRAALQSFLRDAQANHDAAMQRGREFQQNERDQFERSQALDKANQNAIDQSAHGTVLVSLGRKDFVDPTTGQTIEANAYYDHQWLSADGSMLLQTDNPRDPNLDPNVPSYPGAESWNELQPK